MTVRQNLRLNIGSLIPLHVPAISSIFYLTVIPTHTAFFFGFLPASQVNAVLARLAKATGNHAGYNLLCVYMQRSTCMGAHYPCTQAFSSQLAVLMPGKTESHLMTYLVVWRSGTFPENCECTTDRSTPDSLGDISRVQKPALQL